MTQDDFEDVLKRICDQLTSEARINLFIDAKQFENRVREVAENIIGRNIIDFNSQAQAFPDIAINNFGIEVKFTNKDTWRSVANSVLESNRVSTVEKVYLVFGKMGGIPEVKWEEYEQCVMHVRTSHVPRFEVEIGSNKSLFQRMGISYDTFRVSSMHEKMSYIRDYARSRLKEGERLWWLEDSPGEEHSMPIQARLYTTLPSDEKKRLRAEAVLLCPSIVKSGRARNKYNDAVLYLLTYHGVLCHQARDLFSAGSVANPNNDDTGGLYISRSLKILEEDMKQVALTMDDALFEEYWGQKVLPENRISEWLKRADKEAKGWGPSKELFQDE